jgi:hypothetical protein
MLVYFSKTKKPAGGNKLKRKLTETFGKKVNLLTEAAISPSLRVRILSELVVFIRGVNKDGTTKLFRWLILLFCDHA